MEEEQYRVPRPREKRVLAEEISKFSLCYALSGHGKAEVMKGRHKSHSGMDVLAIKAGILAESVRVGDEVAGEALACAAAAIYRPRAYYTRYFLGEMRAELQRGEEAPSTSPHYLPVSLLPPLPDGWRIDFLYPTEKSAFDKPDFPAHVRDVLTRDYNRLPLLVPPGDDVPQGRIRFHARMLELDRDSAQRLAGLGERSFEAYSSRGLTHFLEPLEMEPIDVDSSARGSIFAEMSFPEEPGWQEIIEALEETTRAVVEEVFPVCERGEREEPGCYLPGSGYQVMRFRRRLFALVYAPMIVVYRAPRLLGLYLPGDVVWGLQDMHESFERFSLLLSAALERGLGLQEPLRAEIAYDNRVDWIKERGVMRGRDFEKVGKDYPFLLPTLEWLRGD